MSAECTFYSLAYGTVAKIGPVIGHKINLKRFMKNEIIG